MHALVDVAKPGERIPDARPEAHADSDIRVVNTNLDVGMIGEQ